MKPTKYGAWNAALVAAMLAFSGCASAPSADSAKAPAAADKTTPLIAFSVYAQDTSSFLLQKELEEQNARGIIRAAVYDAQGDARAQLAQVRRLLDGPSRPDVLLIQGVDDINARALARITRAALPAIFITSDASIFASALPDVKEDDLIAGFITFGEAAGKAQAQFVAQALKNAGKTSGRVAILSDIPGSDAQTYRTRGVETALQNTGVAITHQQNANAQRIEAYQIVSQWIDENVSVDAIIANDDRMALGASLALKERNLDAQTIVAGGGFSEDGIPAVRGGSLTMTLVVDAPAIITKAVEISRAMKEAKQKGEPISRNVVIPPVVVTRQNVQQFM